MCFFQMAELILMVPDRGPVPFIWNFSVDFNADKNWPLYLYYGKGILIKQPEIKYAGGIEGKIITQYALLK